MYVFIDCIFQSDHIFLYKPDLSYLCIVITNHSFITRNFLPGNR